MGTQTTDTTGPHQRLAVFLGDWHADGTSLGGPEQSAENPRAGATPWRSIHTARWHSGDFFVVQDERANGPFDTLGLLGWDAEADRYFLRTVENHGFARDYTMTMDGDTWTVTGEHERARYTFVDDGRTQQISWERNRDGHWLPLCDRTAHRVD